MAEKYNGIERYIFADAYNFFLKFKDMQNNDYNWEMCIGEAKLLYFKYKNHPLARGVIASTVNQIEHVVIGKPLDGLTHQQWEDALSIAHKMGW